MWYLQSTSPSRCASTSSWNVVTTSTILTVAAFFAALTIGLVWAFNVALLACKNNTENNLETLFFVLFCSGNVISSTSISSQRIKADHYPFVSDHDKKCATQQYPFWQGPCGTDINAFIKLLRLIILDTQLHFYSKNPLKTQLVIEPNHNRFLTKTAFVTPLTEKKQESTL